MSSANYPYPSQPTPPLKSGAAGIEYYRAYSFIFDNPNWMMNVLFVALCQLIPFVGPIVTMGYQFIVIESLHRRSHATYPDFDFNHFVDYLTRGVWPFLVILVISMVFVPVMYIAIFVGVLITAGVASAVGPDNAPIVATLVGGLLLFALMAVGFAFNLVIQPMFLRSGLAQDFAQGFQISFVRDFIARVWKEMVLTWLFMVATGFLFALAGFVLCVVGVYLSVAILLLAQSHILFQIYELYLTRNGMPVPLKDHVPPRIL